MPPKSAAGLGSDELEPANPFSRGGGGVHFENSVQAYFLALYLIQDYYPLLGSSKTTQYLQVQTVMTDTDDLTIAIHDQFGRERRALIQIKRKLTFTAGEKALRKTFEEFWSDFSSGKMNEEDIFIIVMQAPFSQTVLDHVKPIFEMAQTSISGINFMQKIVVAAKEKQEKVKVMRDTVAGILATTLITDDQFWQFCRKIHVLAYDFDYAEQSKDLAHILSRIETALAPDCPLPPDSVWEKLKEHIRTFNQSSGTINFESLPVAIVSCFKAKAEKLSRKYLVSDTEVYRLLEASAVEDWQTVQDPRTNQMWFNLTKTPVSFAYQMKSKQDFMPVCERMSPCQFPNPIGRRMFPPVSITQAFMLTIYVEGRASENMRFAFHPDGVKETVYPMPVGKKRYSAVACKIAEILGYQLDMQNGASCLEEREVVKEPLIDMNEVQKIIKANNIEAWKQLIEFDRTIIRDLNWITYVYPDKRLRKSQICSADQEEHAQCIMDQQNKGTVITLCLTYGFYEGLEVFLEAYKDTGKLELNVYEFEAPGEEGMSALVRAIHAFKPKLVRLMIEVGADPYLEPNNGFVRAKHRGGNHLMQILEVMIYHICHVALDIEVLSHKINEMLDVFRLILEKSYENEQQEIEAFECMMTDRIQLSASKVTAFPHKKSLVDLISKTLLEELAKKKTSMPIRQPAAVSPTGISTPLSTFPPPKRAHDFEEAPPNKEPRSNSP